MTLQEAMEARHSVRQYTSRPIEPEIVSKLKAKTEEVNRAGNMHIQLVTGEPEAFSGLMARYGKFSGVTDYFALIGPKSPDLDEKAGYYGEQLVLYAQMLGLNTCWVGATFRKVKSAYTIAPGEKLCLVIAVGYGAVQGVPHRSKTIAQLTDAGVDMPAWFQEGMRAVQLAPTAVNQQKFRFSLNGNKVSAKAGSGFFVKEDLGIARYHFEIGAGKDNFVWA